MRALRRGHEVLAEMQLDLSLPPACRAQAQRLAQEHPSPQELVQWVQAGQPGLPSQWADALVATYELFKRTQRRSEGSEQTQSALLFTLRHYPDVATTRLMASDLGFWVWLALER